jgi:small subunit ribosomal protein S18
MRRPENRSDARRRERREYDYKNFRLLRSFITERGRIIPRRISGNCAKHQRELTREIKRARHVALLPFTVLPR